MKLLIDSMCNIGENPRNSDAWSTFNIRYASRGIHSPTSPVELYPTQSCHDDCRQLSGAVLLGKFKRAGRSEPLQPTLRRTIPVWWTYSWRTFAHGLIAMFVTAIPRVVLVGLFGWTCGLESLMGTLVTVALGGAIGLFVIYSNILDENFGDFRVCLLPRHAANDATATPAATPVLS
jgi:hypothetical protein